MSWDLVFSRNDSLHSTFGGNEHENPAASNSFCLAIGTTVFAFLLFGNAQAQTSSSVTAQCVECHTKTTLNIVTDWKQSRHSQVEVGCDTCHGSEHMKADDAAKAKIPTPDTCGQCHETQVEQFTKGKHAKAWTAMEAMPTIHY